MRKTLCILTAGFLALVGAEASFAQDMTFFITSDGPGNGGDFGGIEGADAHCQALAEAAGAGDKTWAAYLGTEREGGRGLDARSRVGDGPWHNAAGTLIAENIDQLHLGPNIVRSTALDENGERVFGCAFGGDYITGMVVKNYDWNVAMSLRVAWAVAAAIAVAFLWNTTGSGANKSAAESDENHEASSRGDAAGTK